jgi:serine/threonine protein kinase
MTYWLLTQKIPFPSCMKRYEFVKGNIDFPLDPLLHNGITEEGMAFLQKALAIQPSERFTALSALDDPWLKDMEQIPCQASEQQEDGDNVSSPARRPADLPRQLDSHDLGSYRLVIAIDYGTAFTSEQSLLVIFGV